MASRPHTDGEATRFEGLRPLASREAERDDRCSRSGRLEHQHHLVADVRFGYLTQDPTVDGSCDSPDAAAGAVRECERNEFARVCLDGGRRTARQGSEGGAVARLDPATTAEATKATTTEAVMVGCL